MSEVNTCRLCHKRRAKRACPAVSGDICAICCGEQREVTLNCPLECQYLREARKHEKAVAVSAAEILHPDIEIAEEFVRAHEKLLLLCVYSLVQASLRTQGAIDNDLLDTLDALIQTRRTAQSGLIYETRPANRIAAQIQQKFQDSLNEYEKVRQERKHLTGYKDSDLLRILVFLRRIGQQNSNGRPKGRMFIDLLRQMTPETRVDERAPSIIL
jgi:hypothetical protein